MYNFTPASRDFARDSTVFLLILVEHEIYLISRDAKFT